MSPCAEMQLEVVVDVLICGALKTHCDIVHDDELNFGQRSDHAAIAAGHHRAATCRKTRLAETTRPSWLLRQGVLLEQTGWKPVTESVPASTPSPLGATAAGAFA
ncbi:hypothetical protein GCM10023335_54900 [Streptomyces siamensis]|uniref:Uncharacterized protein n=1 Tax=Streptomyces siamensis TaxID=1274986 RepID=A0ABP9J705_9ACTN